MMNKILQTGVVLGLGLAALLTPGAARAQAQDQPLQPVTLDLRDAPVRQALEQLFNTARAQYTLDPGIQGFVTLNIRDQPFDSALRLLLRSANPPLTYTREGGVFIVRLRQNVLNPNEGQIPQIDPTAGLDQGGNRATSVPSKIYLTYIGPEIVAQLGGSIIYTVYPGMQQSGGGSSSFGGGGGQSGFGGGQMGGGFGSSGGGFGGGFR